MFQGQNKNYPSGVLLMLGCSNHSDCVRHVRSDQSLGTDLPQAHPENQTTHVNTNERHRRQNVSRGTVTPSFGIARAPQSGLFPSHAMLVWRSSLQGHPRIATPPVLSPPLPTHSLIHSPTHARTHALTHSPTHPPTHARTDSPTDTYTTSSHTNSTHNQ